MRAYPNYSGTVAERADKAVVKAVRERVSTLNNTLRTPSSIPRISSRSQSSFVQYGRLFADARAHVAIFRALLHFYLYPPYFTPVNFLLSSLSSSDVCRIIVPSLGRVPYLFSLPPLRAVSRFSRAPERFYSHSLPLARSSSRN